MDPGIGAKRGKPGEARDENAPPAQTRVVRRAPEAAGKPWVVCRKVVENAVVPGIVAEDSRTIARERGGKRPAVADAKKSAPVVVIGEVDDDRLPAQDKKERRNTDGRRSESSGHEETRAGVYHDSGGELSPEPRMNTDSPGAA